MLRLLVALAVLHSPSARADDPSGRYQSDCLVEASGSRSEAWVFAASVGRFFHQSNRYDDADCQVLAETEAPAGNYQLRALSDGVYELDLSFVQPPGLPPLFTLLRLDGDRLHIGLRTGGRDGTTPERRPRELDESMSFARQH